MENQSLGMMDGAYFVSRKEILDWINATLDLNVTKIEQLGTGAVYSQLVDAYIPGAVTMSKINWKAKSNYEFINNLKVLQGAFVKLNVNKVIEVERLAKAKYQDNLEFIQWLKKTLSDGKEVQEGYDPWKRRNGEDLLYLNKNPRKTKKKSIIKKSGKSPIRSAKKPAEKRVSNLTSKVKSLTIRSEAEKGLEFTKKVLESDMEPAEIVRVLRDKFGIKKSIKVIQPIEPQFTNPEPEPEPIGNENGTEEQENND